MAARGSVLTISEICRFVNLEHLRSPAKRKTDRLKERKTLPSNNYKKKKETFEQPKLNLLILLYYCSRIKLP